VDRILLSTFDASAGLAGTAVRRCHPPTLTTRIEGHFELVQPHHVSPVITETARFHPSGCGGLAGPQQAPSRCACA